MSKQWYVSRNAVCLGPYSTWSICDFIEKRQILATDLISINEKDNWQLASVLLPGMFEESEADQSCNVLPRQMPTFLGDGEKKPSSHSQPLSRIKTGPSPYSIPSPPGFEDIETNVIRPDEINRLKNQILATPPCTTTPGSTSDSPRHFGKGFESQETKVAKPNPLLFAQMGESQKAEDDQHGQPPIATAIEDAKSAQESAFSDGRSYSYSMTSPIGSILSVPTLTPNRPKPRPTSATRQITVPHAQTMKARRRNAGKTAFKTLFLLCIAGSTFLGLVILNGDISDTFPSFSLPGLEGQQGTSSDEPLQAAIKPPVSTIKDDIIKETDGQAEEKPAPSAVNDVPSPGNSKLSRRIMDFTSDIGTAEEVASDSASSDVVESPETDDSVLGKPGEKESAEMETKEKADIEEKEKAKTGAKESPETKVNNSVEQAPVEEQPSRMARRSVQDSPSHSAKVLPKKATTRPVPVSVLVAKQQTTANRHQSSVLKRTHSPVSTGTPSQKSPALPSATLPSNPF